jgi:hypothetical protein
VDEEEEVVETRRRRMRMRMRMVVGGGMELVLWRVRVGSVG